jgi:hypothetical protein
MLKDEVSFLHKSLIKSLVCCQEMDYESEDYRFLLNSIFELGDFIWKFDGAEKYNWHTAESDSNIFTIKTICEVIIEQGVDVDDACFKAAKNITARYAAAIDVTKYYLKSVGMLEVLKGDWALIVPKL